MFQLIDLGAFGQKDTGDIPLPIIRQGDFSGVLAPERGIFRTIIEETLRDFGGAARTISATALTPFDLLGVNVPLTFDDLSKRDLTGALMVAALGAGGVAAGAARTLPFVVKAGGAGTAAGRALATASTELVAGAAFGLVRPLEEDEERIRAIIGDAAFFGAFGAGASFAKTGVKATFGGAIANIREANARALVALGAKKLGDEALVREIAGVTLLNAETGSIKAIRRDLANPNKVVMTTRVDKQATTRTFDDFGEALADAAGSGHLENTGPFRTSLFRSVERFDSQSLTALTEDGSRILEELRGIQFGEYRAVQLAAQELRESESHFAALVTDIVAPSDLLGLPTLEKKVRNDIIGFLGGGKRARKLTDANLLREGVQAGFVSLESLEAGVSNNQALRELFLNSVIPNKNHLIISKTNDLYLKSILTAHTVAKMHPVIMPLFQNADKRLANLSVAEGLASQTLADLRATVTKPKTATRGRDIIHASGVDTKTNTVRTIEQATEIALAEARKTGDTELISFVEGTTTLLAEYRTRLTEAGIIPEGLPGYFPIVNTDNWRIAVKRTGKKSADFEGFVGNQRKALERAEEILRTDATAESFTITPRTFFHDGDNIPGLDNKAFATFVKALQQSAEISSREARDIAEGVVRRTGTKPLKSGGFTKKRELGIQDYSKDPFDALRSYTLMAERVLALRDFEREAATIIAKIPTNQNNLIAWSEQYVADILGRPRPIEKAFDAVVARLGLDLGPQALKRYSTALRKWESFSRLGGFWSGVVNLTQISTNTNAILGPRWTAKGFEAIAGPKAMAERMALLRAAGVREVDMFVPLTAEGNLQTFATIRSAIKEKKFGDAIYRTALFTFNGAERVNRLVTAWGSYSKAISEGKSVQAAGAIANADVLRTQFNYRLSNMPEILRGPAGATLFQFKSFIINEIEFMASLNSREFARFGAGLWATGGAALLLNTPGVDIVDEASGLFFDKKMSEALKLAPGENKLGRGIVFGLPGLLGKVGADLSDYVGVGSVKDVSRGLFGPAVNDLKVVGDFFRDASIDMTAGGRIRNETKQRFTQRLMPSAIRRAIRAQDIMNTGEVRDPYKGKLIYRPEERFRTAAQTFIGAPPIRLAQERAMDQVASRVRDRFIRTHSEFAKEAAQAILDKKPGLVAEIKADAIRAGIILENRAIKYQVGELQRTAQERRLRRTPAQRREIIQDAYESIGRAPQGIEPRLP